MQQWMTEKKRISPGIDIMYLKIHHKLIFIVNHEDAREYILRYMW